MPWFVWSNALGLPTTTRRLPLAAVRRVGVEVVARAAALRLAHVEPHDVAVAGRHAGHEREAGEERESAPRDCRCVP
jgi:hypothetical protein